MEVTGGSKVVVVVVVEAVGWGHMQILTFGLYPTWIEFIETDNSSNKLTFSLYFIFIKCFFLSGKLRLQKLSLSIKKMIVIYSIFINRYLCCPVYRNHSKNAFLIVFIIPLKKRCTFWLSILCWEKPFCN